MPRKCARPGISGGSLKLSNDKPTQVSNGGTSKRTGTSIQALKRPTDYRTKTKAYRQSVSLNCANNIISQLMFAFTGRNRFNSMESLWRPFKNQKPPAKLIYACIYQYISKITQSI
jgi:hypothetical protein